VAKIELLNVTTKVMDPNEAVMNARRLTDQFSGLPGSFSPSNTTRLGSIFGAGAGGALSGGTFFSRS
jgi:hypothetical protein